MSDKASSYKKMNLFLAMLFAAIVILVFLIVDQKSDIELVYHFDESKGIKSGNDVRLLDTKVGEVENVEIVSEDGTQGVKVTVRIDADKRSQIYAPPNSSARIKKDLGLMEKPYVEVINRTGSDYKTIETGMLIEGLNGWADEKLWTTADSLKSKTSQLVQSTKDSMDSLKQWATEGDGDQLKQDIRDYLVSLEENTFSKTSGARDRLQESIDKGEALYEQLNEEHGAEVKENLETTLEYLKSQSEELAQQGKQVTNEILKDENSDQNSQNPATRP